MILEAMPPVLIDAPLAAGLAPEHAGKNNIFFVYLQYFLNFRKVTYSLWLLPCQIYALDVNGTP